MPELTVVVPTLDEESNIGGLVADLAVALAGVDAEVVVVDDGSDRTCTRAEVAGRESGLPVRAVHRSVAVGGLSGAVVAGMALAESPWVVVMDGDRQHPPADVPRLLAAARAGSADLVVASRFAAGGSAVGLSSAFRRAVSGASTRVARRLFPAATLSCTDPMSGFFAVRLEPLDLGRLRPRGYKILLEILATHELRTTEIGFDFAARTAGGSKASVRHGLQLGRQLVALRRAAGRRAAVSAAARRDAAGVRR